MKRFQFLICAALLFSALALQACESSGGYNQTPWQYNNEPRQGAETPPNDISELNQVETAPLSQNAMTNQNLQPVKVAILLPLSGQNARLGDAMLNAAQMALFEVGHNSFELAPYDTKGTHQGAKSSAQNAVNEGAQLILGPLFADAVRGAKSVARASNINMVAFSTDWTLADNSTFIMGFVPFDQVKRVSAYAKSQNISNIGVFAPANNYGDAVLSAYKNAASAYGMNTIKTERFAQDGSSLSVQMRNFAQYDQRVAGSNVAPAPYDAIFMPVGGEMARRVASFASQYEMRPDQVKRLGTGLWDDNALASEPALNGAWFAAPDPNARRNFEREYFQTYAVKPLRISSLAYDATALAAVLARSGINNGGRPAFDSISIQNPNGFTGIDGIFRFMEGGLVERGLAVLEFKNGRMNVIDPAPRTFQSQRM